MKMQQSVSITAIRSTVSNNSKLLPIPQTGSAESFRNTFAGFRQNPTSAVASSGNSRENVLDAIAQVRATTAPALASMPAVSSVKTFDIRSYYTMPPEDVKPLARELSEELHNTDFSGKTGVEVYEYIESKYKEVFGEDFMIAHSLFGSLYNTGEYLTGMNPDRSSN
jgi:hypothetical protein